MSWVEEGAVEDVGGEGGGGGKGGGGAGVGEGSHVVRGGCLGVVVEGMAADQYFREATFDGQCDSVPADGLKREKDCLVVCFWSEGNSNSDSKGTSAPPPLNMASPENRWDTTSSPACCW